MKLPAVAIAAAFAGGILLDGLQRLRWIEPLQSPRVAPQLGALIGAGFLLIILGVVLSKRGAVWPAAGVSAAVWVALVGSHPPAMAQFRLDFRDAMLFLTASFHRISLLGPVVNLCVVPLMGVIVPLGFVTLGMATLLPRFAALAGHPLIWLVWLQQRIVSFFAVIPSASYRIPGPPVWVMCCFFLAAVGVVVALRPERMAVPI